MPMSSTIDEAYCEGYKVGYAGGPDVNPYDQDTETDCYFGFGIGFIAGTEDCEADRITQELFYESARIASM